MKPEINPGDKKILPDIRILEKAKKLLATIHYSHKSLIKLVENLNH
jgi:hypothetical protein